MGKSLKTCAKISLLCGFIWFTTVCFFFVELAVLENWQTISKLNAKFRCIKTKINDTRGSKRRQFSHSSDYFNFSNQYAVCYEFF